MFLFQLVCILIWNIIRACNLLVIISHYRAWIYNYTYQTFTMWSTTVALPPLRTDIASYLVSRHQRTFIEMHELLHAKNRWNGGTFRSNRTGSTTFNALFLFQFIYSIYSVFGTFILVTYKVCKIWPVATSTAAWAFLVQMRTIYVIGKYIL